MEDPQFWDCRYAPRPTQIYEAKSQSALANLRLVSKVFCSSATPRLFREVNATMTSRVDGTLQSRPLNKLLELSRGDYARYVRVISVGVARVIKHKMVVANYIQDLGSILPACFPSYQRLETLRVSGPCYPGGHERDLPFPENLRLAFRNTIENTLGYAPAGSLTELSLTLPLTHDFAALIDDNQYMAFTWQAPFQDILATLSHLDIAIGDNSGQGGQSWMLKHSSSAQKAYPNERFAPGFFKFIEFAKNVETLRIRATHVLDMDLLNTARFRKLRILELRNIKVSWDRFVAVVENNAETLRAIDLDGIQLKSGTWKALLLKFCSLPQLDYFAMDACRYSTDGSSMRMVPAAAAEMDSAIETRSILDFHALGHLQRQVMYRRDILGLPQMMEYDFKYSNWKTLEEVEFPECWTEGI